MMAEDGAAVEGVRLVQRLSDALLDWTAVPPHVIEATRPRRADRTPAQQLLTRSASKLCEDMGAAVSLLRQGFAGTPHALVRMCRENVVSLLYLSLAEPIERDRYAAFVAGQKPATARLKLHRLANAL